MRYLTSYAAIILCFGYYKSWNDFAMAIANIDRNLYIRGQFIFWIKNYIYRHT